VLSDLLGLGTGPGVIGGLAPAAPTPGMTGWLAYQSAESTLYGQGMHATSVAFAPTVDVFVADRLSLGAQLSLFHAKFDGGRGSSASTTGGGLRPRIGWLVPLGDTLALWPRAFGAITVLGRRQDFLAGDGMTILPSRDTMLEWRVGAEADLVARLGSVVALTFGPRISYGKVLRADTTSQDDTSRTISLGVQGGISLVL
jgi:hypothetical protein